MEIETLINIFKKIDALASSFFGSIKNDEIDVEMHDEEEEKRLIKLLLIREFFRAFSTKKYYKARK